MNNIKKLAIEHGTSFYKLSAVFENEEAVGVTFTWAELEAFAKALQSSEPVADTLNKLVNSMVDLSAEDKKLIQDNLWNLYQGETTYPPASVSLEKYNKLLRLVIEAKYNLGLKNEVPLHIIFAKVEKIVQQAIAEAEGKS